MQEHALSKYKTIIAVIILTGIAVTANAQIDRDELSNLPPVVFINYEGPHAIINTREEIRQIGTVLGQSIFTQERGIAGTLANMSAEERRRYSYIFRAGAQNRYFVIHSVSAPDGRKLDADIFGLGVDAGVDHIRNLRWIIQGYLQEAYSYSASDAAILAEYITIYNAVYRGNWDYFTQRYKTPVMDNLTRDRAGLSIRYDEWPGRTLMLIPLGIFGVDTSAISDERVIEEMRKEDDQGVPSRQDMTDIKEREAEQAQQQAQQEREQIREQERQIADERNQIEQERQQTQDDREAGRITEDEANQRQQDLDRREDDLAQREDDLDQRRDDAQALEDFAEQKIDEAQQDREEIARDQQSTIAAPPTSGILGITIESTNPPKGRLIRFNPATGEEMRRSPLNTVHVRTVTFIGGKILAIAGENVGQGAVRLIEITQDTLVMAKQGDDDIKSGSLLWVNGNDLYAITNESGSNDCYLGRFNMDLVLQTKSVVKVHPDCAVTIQQGRLLTQREDGSALILDPSSLQVMFASN
jgi:flagellar biosynthesis GTPase FlhF